MIKICPYCKKEFEIIFNGNNGVFNKKFCSDSCRKNAYQTHKRVFKPLEEVEKEAEQHHMSYGLYVAEMEKKNVKT